MKARFVALLPLSVLFAVSAFGQYAWDYTRSPVVSDTTRWSSNGSPSYGSYGVNFSGSGGSLISTPAIAGSYPNDYEVASTLAINSAGGTYIHFLRTSGGTVQSGSGSYISVEVVIPPGFTSPGTATLNVNQCVGGCASGPTTNFVSASIAATNGMRLRTVIWGGVLWVFTGTGAQTDVFIWGGYVPVTSGNPGIGGYGIPAGSGFSGISLGHHDIVAPGQVNATTISSSVFPGSVSLRWQGVLDDTAGIGLWHYNVYRNGVWAAAVTEPELVDTAVAPSTSYSYTIYAQDFHGNYTQTSFSVTTPPASAIDPHRTGIYTTGSYWGGGGEQIDTLSGNLNFSLPLLTAQGRAGSTVPIGLVYNSQNWRQDSGVNWKLGDDVGYGFGWQMLIGSITPYYQCYWCGVQYYVYTDSTGAQYRLTVNNSGVWSGTSGVYVWFDSNANKLHFRDGSFWVMGCTSGGTEADAGTMYPTVIEDVSGNQITVKYLAGANLPSTAANTSARISYIEDARANGGASYSFGYNTDTPVPHLYQTYDSIGTGASYSLSYNEGVAVEPPFGTDPSFAGVTTAQLASMTTPTAGSWQFTYDSAGASELLQAKFPWGGHLRWTYGTDPYSGSRDLRAVSGRYLAADSGGATEWSYGISRDNASASGAIVHGTMTLSDASGVGAKTWNFTHTSTDPAWEIGLAKEFVQSASAGGTVLQDDVYTWSQDPALNPYISTKASTTGQGTSNMVTATSTQTLDQYGNVTQSVIYPYNNATTPLKTFANTYSAAYASNYIFNRLVTSSVTLSTGSPITLVTNYYTGGDCTGAVNIGSSTPCGGWATPPAGGPAYNIDPAPPIPVNQRGYVTSSVTPAKTTTFAVYTYGSPAMTWGSDGSVSYASADASTNFNAPATITSQSYTTALTYNSWLGVTQTRGQNGEQMSMSYDSVGRPSGGTSPYCGSGCYGPTVSYSYGTSSPFTQTKTGPDGVTTTTLDGLGRAILVARGDTSGVHSSTSTTYAPCACSPLGKVQQTSQPFVGSSASAWTSYTYDGLGRPLTVQQPDGGTPTTYAYSGNVTTVTDPKGNAKQFTTDVEGNLVTVAEPDPCLGTSTFTLVTSYTFDWMKHVTGVAMTRSNPTYSTGTPPCSESGTPVTQQRTFAYDSSGRLTSATNPENGMVSYAYNSDNTLQMKTDAKGQQIVYTYDSLKRLTMTQYYPSGTSNPEDGCQRVTNSYDTNPYNSSFSQNSYGRLTAVLYGASTGSVYAPGAFCTQGLFTYGLVTYFADMYSYHPAGGVTAKRLAIARGYSWNLSPSNPFAGMNPPPNVEVDYTYDNAGRTATTTYPMAEPFSPTGPNTYYYGATPAGITLTYGYDSMGRPNSLTDASGATGAAWGLSGPLNWAQNVQYDYAGRMTSAQFMIKPSYGYSGYVPAWTQETMGYNVNGQLTSLGWAFNPYGTGFGTATTITYTYSGTQNNGQITQVQDQLSGETIVYTYDALKRLTLASSTPISGSSPAAWTQSYQYDGFGNLTAKVLNGGTPVSIGVTAATNRLSSAGYDLNGNMTSGSGATMVYDEANRISSAAETSGGIEYYGYSADNKRFYKYTSAGTEQLTLYGARGEKLGVYTITNSMGLALCPSATNIWFAGRLILESNQATFQDRLGTNRSGFVSAGAPYINVTSERFYPYGDEITSTLGDHEKFATYTRDDYTGFDYANQRYYASTYGRFNTADPYQASGGPSSPASWNRYSYTRGDPVNRVDPSGLRDNPCDGYCGDDGGGGGDWGPGIGDNGGYDPAPGCLPGDGCPAYCPPSIQSCGGFPVNPEPAPPSAGGSGSGGVIQPFTLGQLGQLGLWQQQGLISGWSTTPTGVGLAVTAADWELISSVCIAQPEICVAVGAGLTIYAAYRYAPALIQAIANTLGENQNWPACSPPVGTIGYRIDRPPSRPHAGMAEHVHLYRMNQNPTNGQCFWQPIGVTAPPPPAGAVPIGPAQGGTGR